MASIEERAEKWVHANYTSEYIANQDEGFAGALIEAYLAGAAQARADEAAHRQWEAAGGPGPAMP